VAGTVSFKKGRRNRTFVSIIPFTEVTETLDTKPKAKPAPKPVQEVVEVPVAKTVTSAAAPVVETPKAEEPPVEMAAPAPAAEAPSKKDNLKIVEGIGPKIETLLNDAGIYTFAELSQADPEKIREILEAAGPRYRIHDPATWPQQAGMAAEGRMDELKEWQDQLKGGKEEA
jgi:large subunit ribosomal protein L27